MPYCPICEKTFPTKNGLKGHFRFKHRYELGKEEPAKETVFTKAIRSNIERRVSGDAMMKAMEEERMDDKGKREKEKKAKETDLGGLDLEW